MKLRIFFLLFILNCLIIVRSLAENKEFENYASHESQLMHDAYVRKDAKTFGQILDGLKSRYNQLSVKDQKDYAGFLIGGYYNYSCLYSLLNNKSLAIEYLDKAIKAGYSNYSHITEDTDLDNIRRTVSFVALVQPLRAVGDYMYIIKKAKTYNAADNRPLPAFTYQSADNPNLVLLKNTFKLDSVAGSGNEASRAINILHWVHNTVHHDGQHESGIKHFNAFEIVSIATAKNIGVSCGELATVLNECYLAMGWRSRKVYCFPKDSLHTDYDSHVINIVYLPSKKKWIWVDPTNDAYVMDENGELQSIEEVRERIINDKPLIINPDANWNHKASETKEHYFYYYMAKNLYRLRSPTNSEYDMETASPGKTISYVQLLPLDYFKQTPDKSESINNNTKATFINYNTNNPSLFWAPPEN